MLDIQEEKKDMKVPCGTFWELSPTTVYLCMNLTNVI